MGFVTEWILAVNRGVWFPALWLTGLEARPLEAANFDDLRNAQPCCDHVCPAATHSKNGAAAASLLLARPPAGAAPSPTTTSRPGTARRTRSGGRCQTASPGTRRPGAKPALRKR